MEMEKEMGNFSKLWGNTRRSTKENGEWMDELRGRFSPVMLNGIF